MTASNDDDGRYFSLTDMEGKFVTIRLHVIIPSGEAKLG